jgi:putative holliday junction resolvase
VRAQPVSGTVLGFDFGEKRVGVAVGETATGIASALRTIDAPANDARFAAIDAVVREWKPVLLVVGRPRHDSGEPHEVARLAEKFARRLCARHNLPVVFVDETLSSAAAESDFREARTRTRRPADVDALAARIILQSYLDDPQAHERLAS